MKMMNNKQVVVFGVFCRECLAGNERNEGQDELAPMSGEEKEKEKRHVSSFDTWTC